MSDKPVILFFPFDLMSHYFRSLRIAIFLNDRYDVYMKWSDKYDYWLKKSGLKTFHCIDFDAEAALERTGKFDFSWLNADALEAIFLDQVRAIGEYNPSLVIGDTSFTLKMASEAAGVQYLSVLNGYSTRFYKHTRRLSPGHPAESLMKWLPDVLLLPIIRTGEAWNFLLILREFNKVRAKHKLQKTTHYLKELSGNQNVICDIPEVFPQRNLPDNFQFIGPLFFKTQVSNSAILKKMDPDKKTILLTLGSSKEWERLRFFNTEEFSIYNVIVVGDKNNVLNSSFLLKTPFVDFDEVLPEVDLVICHGGNGTLNQALFNKVPVLCYQSHLEQTWNVHRIEQLGYGQSLNNVEPEDIHILINEWMDKKSKIQWNLDFEPFNNDLQNDLLLKIIWKMIPVN